MLRARTLHTHTETQSQRQRQMCEHKEGYNNCKWKCAKVPSEKRVKDRGEEKREKWRAEQRAKMDQSS